MLCTRRRQAKHRQHGKDIWEQHVSQKRAPSLRKPKAFWAGRRVAKISDFRVPYLPLTPLLVGQEVLCWVHSSDSEVFVFASNTTGTMFIPKENRIAVFSYLFKEGVLVVKKDTRTQTHPHIEGATNLEVLMLMKSLESREFVRITFSWQYNYCYLTDEGIAYLREYLGLPESIVPATHKKQASRPDMRDREEDKFGGGGRPAFRGGGDREYRGREGGGGGGGIGRGGGI